MFTIYKNSANQYAAIHRASCNRLRIHGGVSRRDPPTGEYIDCLEDVRNCSTGGG